jgi:branched-chain amino acid transport system ATP-binding protein
MSATPILEVIGLSAGYGKVRALHEVSLVVPQGAIVTVIGPNGAGKSTLLNGLMGLLRTSGELRFEGRSIRQRTVEDRVMQGLSLVSERRELFADMSVHDNLLLGGFSRHRRGEGGAAEQMAHVFGLFPRLKERAGQLAGTLSGGERQMLAVGRALMGRPRLLMLDEPSLGLAPRIVREVLQVVARLRDHGVSTLLVEQNACAALRLADHAYVLEGGRIALEGPAAELASNPRIVESYLGIAAPRPAADAVPPLAIADQGSP